MDEQRIFKRDDSQLRFGGKLYQYGGVYPTKVQADALAKRLRSQGRNARVVAKHYFGNKKSYFIYWRKRSK